MALPVLPILKALAPLLAEAGGIVARTRSAGHAAKAEDRLVRLERETGRAGEVLTGLAEQLQAVAQALRAQVEQTETLQRRVRALLVVSAVALAAGIGALVTVLVRTA